MLVELMLHNHYPLLLGQRMFYILYEVFSFHAIVTRESNYLSNALFSCNSGDHFGEDHFGFFPRWHQYEVIACLAALN